MQGGTPESIFHLNQQHRLDTVTNCLPTEPATATAVTVPAYTHVLGNTAVNMFD